MEGVSKMNKLSFKNVFKLIGFDLRVNKKFILAWIIVIFAIMLMYMSLYGAMKDIAKFKMEQMPEQLMDFFNMKDFSEMGTYNGYFALIYNIVMIPITIFAVIFTAKLITAEEKSKSIEFLYSMPFSRVEIFVSKILTSIIAINVVLIFGAVPTVVFGYVHEGSALDILELSSVIKVTSFTSYFFASLTALLTGISGKTTGGTASIFVIVSYFLGYLGKLLSGKADWLLYLSPFELFETSKSMTLSNETLVNLGVYFVVLLVFYVVGTYLYRKRDFSL
ncbi:MAG: hypothetical protein CSB16_00860 [Clostridiales bacterium]|nr:MAG: hypothetical protein CSB16_00860 [Clostridiales bacterium]